MNEDQLKDALDLDTWDEITGVCSVKMPLCPHCNSDLIPDELEKQTCSACGKTFVWQRIKTPLGFAWQTWQRNPLGNGAVLEELRRSKS